MEQCARRPNGGLFKGSNAALRERGESSVKFSIEQMPRCFVASFEMPSVRASVVSRRVVPCDAKRPVFARERA